MLERVGFPEVFLKRPEAGAVVFTLLIVVAFSVQTEGTWISHANMSSVLQVTATLGIMALGQALVITTREIDISVGSVFGFGALTYLGAAESIGVAPAAVVAILAGCAIGLLNGFLVTRLRVPSLIATLGTLFIFRGLCIALTEGFSFSASAEVRESPFFALLGGAEVLGFNDAVLWMVALVIVLHLAIFLTPFGNRLLALGGDADSALSRGVRVQGMKWLAFVLCSALAALAGVLEASKIGFADGSFGRLQELEAIAACVIGGCLLTGGRCSVVGVILGAFLLSGIQSFLVLNGVQPQWFMILLGLLVVGALLGDQSLRRWMMRRA